MGQWNKNSNVGLLVPSLVVHIIVCQSASIHFHQIPMVIMGHFWGLCDPGALSIGNNL
jgi:hypothetical protein